MSGKERILTIRLLEKLSKNQSYAESLGITVEADSAYRETETCGEN